MNISHSLSFPILEYETATSYLSRLTRYCGLSSPNDFCLDHGFRWQDFVRGDDVLFGKVAAIGGANAEDLKRWAVRTVDHNRFVVSGQIGTKKSLVRSRLRVCPKCLLEDREHSGHYGPYRRHFWHFWSIRACAVHEVPLMIIPPERYTLQNYDFAGLVDRNWTSIAKGAMVNIRKPSTGLERYILNRLNGDLSNVFLDGMPLHIASRLCEVLGFVLNCGAERQITSASQNELSSAGQTGFDALCTGETGLYSALDTLVTSVALQTVRHRADFGAFFEWLRSSNLGAEFAPLRDLVRSYIFRTYPVGKGELILGQACSEVKTYTINGAWNSLGMQRKRMNRVLIDKGVAKKDLLKNKVCLNVKLNNADLHDISERMAARVNSFEARAFLNVSGDFLRLLRERGILTTVTDALDQVPKYEKLQLECLTTRLEQRVIETPIEAGQMVSIAEACRRLGCPADEVVELILGDKLSVVTRKAGSIGLAGIQVDVEDVRNALPQFEMAGFTKGEACNILRVTYRTINFLIAEGQLRSVRVRNPKSRQSLDAVCKASIAEFETRFETLGRLAKRYHRQPGPLGCYLEAKGICPIETPKKISWYFERKGLERRLRNIGLREPVSSTVGG